MPSFADLSDAAIIIHRILKPRRIDFGIFGGYAINVLGGNRTSKDVDCAVGLTKDEIVNLFGQFPQFKYMDNTRQDVAIFMLGEVLIEFFPSLTNMDRLRDSSGETLVRGTRGSDTTTVLDPSAVFKGKLEAAANRDKYTDAANLLLLAGQFEQYLKDRRGQFNQTLAGLAMKRYSHLEAAFARIGIDVEKCKSLTENADVQRLPVMLNSVQNGLLFGL